MSIFNTILAFIFGSIMGSFLNVVIYRLPLMLRHHKTPFNLFVPRSHCPYCKKTVANKFNIPILGFILTKSRCAYCNHKISLMYPLVELTTATMFVLILYLTSNLPIYQYMVYCVYFSFLIALSVIDYQTMLLPDELTLTLLWGGLIVSSLSINTVKPVDAILGCVFGYMLLWSVYHLFKLVTKKEGMGYGDFKLLAALGAWNGLQSITYIILLSATSALIYAIALMVSGKFHHKNQEIPFGPFLCIAGSMYMLHNIWLANSLI